jgi:hypothetical protein
MSDLFTDAEKFMSAINAMKMAGVGSMLWYVRGSGDSPDDEEYFWYKDPTEAKKCINSWDNEDEHKALEAAVFERMGGSMPATEVLSKICWDALDTINQGWYNNEGGYGYVWITPGDDTNPPQVGSILFEYPEPEAVETGRASLWGSPLDGSENSEG